MVAANTSRGRILYTYDTVMHGFAVQLTGDEAQRMSSSAGVTGVYEDRVIHTHTTRSPGFLGLDPGFGAWEDADFGDGVIIGFVDTGIWPESSSFDDSGLSPVRPSWRGGCVNADDFNASLCNNKLVGARAFTSAGQLAMASTRDTDGHGTHVASTAAGSEVRGAGVAAFARGTARGVAPKARIAMYKVPDGSPPVSDIVAAIDAAVKDGVDIISISLGYDPSPFHNDALAIAAFGAERKGVFVVLSGGNEGPESSTVINLAPWMTTVGAATVDRVFPASLSLRDDGGVLTGQSLYSTKSNGVTAMVSLVSSSCNKDDLGPDNVTGKIVVCVGNNIDLDTLQRVLPELHAAGVILTHNSSWSPDGDGVWVMAFPLPTLILSHTASEMLQAYMTSSPYPVACLRFSCDTVIGENRAPMVASLSSRGPNPVVPELLKPDVIAPGMNILGAWIGETSSSLGNRRKDKYMIDSGTSMACPHVAGVAALIKKKHPSWTPAMIRSALMTTAATLDNTDRDIIDDGFTGDGSLQVATPFAAGAGHVRPQLALDPGLVYDAGARDYIDFLCSLNYTTEQLHRFAPDMATSCTRTDELSSGPADLNYPSFVVVFNGSTDVRTLTRTVTKVSKEAETYNVTVVAPEHVKVTVTPAILEFKEQYEKKSYAVQFISKAHGIENKAVWEFGRIIWENNKRQVTSPVAVELGELNNAMLRNTTASCKAATSNL
ncbi:hypothetical protein PR202_gb21366 [Eleusine coracana subsp. coracana]|uniref:Uncharacterized protein n=1 Tax=Eleusine coracana subsp. coracana TaxID=191504 RepID=A0AAV5FEJ7_ELECO|nr:hypothetical protein PR202_gb21366 [Eleusine coracana subsp. coracana]